MHEIGTLQSLNQPKYKDIPITPEKITIGRSPKCTIVLSDIRCSGVHCEITPVSKNDWEFIVQDYSSNGTYINGVLVINI
jgi:adenylate cyclase